MPKKKLLFAPSTIRVWISKKQRHEIVACAMAYTKANKRRGQHGGPLSHVVIRVLQVLLDSVNRGNGACFPSYETIAEKVGCVRSTVGRALRLLREAGLLAWQQRYAVKEINGEMRAARATNCYWFVLKANRKSDAETTEPSPRTPYITLAYDEWDYTVDNSSSDPRRIGPQGDATQGTGAMP